MQKKNLVLMINRQFSIRDYERLGVEELSNYFEVWVFECLTGNKFLRSRFHGPKSYGIQVNKTFNKHVYIQNTETLAYYLNKIPVSFYVDILVGPNLTNFIIRNMLKKHKALRVKLYVGELPSYGNSQGMMSKLKRAMMMGGFVNKLQSYIFANFIIKYFEPKIDIAIFSGEICLKRYPFSPKNVIWAHSIDYQIYLDVLESADEFVNEKSYAVFLDQNAPAHPDYAYHGNKPPVTKNCYYKALNKFFDDFEKQTGIEVIIAGHPRSSLEEGKNWPCKQFILRNTPKLIKGAKLVFAHYSTAISFPVLWRKPIVQLTTNEYLNSYRKDRFKAFADRLKLPVLNVDKYAPSMLRNYQEIDVEKQQLEMYEKYELNYLKSHLTVSKNMWKIVAENLKSYNGRHESNEI